MNPREIRAYAILAKGDVPQPVGMDNWLLKSQNGGGKYRVSRCGSAWSCECPDHTYRKVPCKHMLTVMLWLRMKEGKKASFALPTEGQNCPSCGSEATVKRGVRCTRGDPKQRYGCISCGRRFVSDVCPNTKATERTVTAVMDLWYKGMSVRAIQQHLRQFHGFRVHYATIYRWIRRFSKRMAEHTDRIHAESCGVIHADETMINVKGKQRYFWNAMDRDSRFILASNLTDDRDGSYAIKLFAEAEERAGAKPKLVITDGYGGYQYGVRKAYRSLKHPVAVEHLREIGFMNRLNNNRIERYMGTIKGRTKTLRALKQKGAYSNDLLKGWVAYYNFIRPHMALHGHTPAEAAGIGVARGENRWLEVLKSAGAGGA